MSIYAGAVLPPWRCVRLRAAGPTPPTGWGWDEEPLPPRICWNVLVSTSPLSAQADPGRTVFIVSVIRILLFYRQDAGAQRGRMWLTRHPTAGRGRPAVRPPPQPRPWGWAPWPGRVASDGGRLQTPQPEREAGEQSSKGGFPALNSTKQTPAGSNGRIAAPPGRSPPRARTGQEGRGPPRAAAWPFRQLYCQDWWVQNKSSRFSALDALGGSSGRRCSPRARGVRALRS